MESNELKNSKKKWIGLALILIILAMTIYIYKHQDTLFTNKATITYADGCTEIYEDTILVSDICHQGRVLENSVATSGQEEWTTMPTINLTGINLT